MSLNENDNIDLKLIYKKIYNNKLTLFYSILYSFLFSLFIALITPPKYSTSITFIPQNESNESNQVSSLASIAGISIANTNSNYIQPNLYPKIIKDLKFKRDVLKMKLDNDLILKDFMLKKEPYLYDYLINYTIGMPYFIYQSLKSIIFKSKTIGENNNLNKKNEYYVDEEELKLLRNLDQIIKINVDDKDGFVELIVEFDNPRIATIIVLNYQKILQDYIINYKIRSSLEILKFTENALLNKRKEFEKIQNELAEFKDNNQNISTSVFNTKLFKLQNKFDLESSLYESLSQKVSQAKIDVTKNTPIFTIIENPKIPISRNNSRFMILLQFTLLGFTAYLFYTLTKDRINEIIEYLNK